MTTQARAAVAADIVEAADLVVAPAHDQDALAAPELEHEEVARLGDPAHVVDHLPEVVRHQALVDLPARFVDVVLGVDRVSYPPHGAGFSAPHLACIRNRPGKQVPRQPEGGSGIRSDCAARQVTPGRQGAFLVLAHPALQALSADSLCKR